MADNSSTTIITADEMQQCFQSILIKEGFTEAHAAACATIFVENSVDGVYSHGVNRFPTFVQFVKDGFVKPDAVPSLEHKFGAVEQWNGNLGPGTLNAVHATERACQLAAEFGIGCVAFSNTNHWMRAGNYGWKAAKAGYVLIAWTNTTALMPAWGATDAKLGNNPLIMAMPYKEEAIVLDMAMSQFSFGAMEMAAMKNEKLKVPGGFDAEGNITDDPALIMQTRRPLPIGYWKGAGLALLLDILAAVLSGGLATHAISASKKEFGLSQVFISIDPSKLGNHSMINKTIEDILIDYKNSIPVNQSNNISYPGERLLNTRRENMEKGIPVLKKVWDEIMTL